MEKRRGGITRSEWSGEIEVMVAIPVEAMISIIGGSLTLTFGMKEECRARDDIEGLWSQAPPPTFIKYRQLPRAERDWVICNAVRNHR